MLRLRRLLLVALAMGGASSVSSNFTFAAAAAATQPAATKPAQTRQLIKISKPLADRPGDQITVLLDVNDAPELKDWAIQAGNYALEKYPEIERQLPSDTFTPPREFEILIKPVKGVAYTGGTVITCNSDYVAKHKDDLGMVAHELTHVIQHYRRAKDGKAENKPGWLVEGIADWVRYYVIEPGPKNARWTRGNADYHGGYGPAAALLDYVEKTRGAGSVKKLNAALREARFTPELFKEIAGGDPDEVWAKAKEAAAAAAAQGKGGGEKKAG